MLHVGRDPKPESAQGASDQLGRRMDRGDGAGSLRAAGNKNPKDYRHLDNLQILSVVG